MKYIQYGKHFVFFKCFKAAQGRKWEDIAIELDKRK